MSEESEENKNSVTLSRRKALAGIGTIGAAAGLGGLGTFAQFTDTEETMVEFTAGGIDGLVRAGASYNGEDLVDFSQSEFEPQSTDGIGLDVTLSDVKPGDHGCFAFGIRVQNNPAWVASCIGYEGDHDWRQYEPEVTDSDGSAPDPDSPTFTSTDVNEKVKNGNGELAENILTLPFYKGASQPTQEIWDPCVFFDESVDGQFNADNYEGSGAVGTTTEFWSNSESGLTPATLEDAATFQAVDTVAWDGAGNTQTYDVGDDIIVDKGCVFLNGDGPDTDNQQGAAPLEPGDEIWMGWDWHLPFDVGNVAQGDKITLNLGFVFGQVRHTESVELSNVFAPQENLPDGN